MKHCLLFSLFTLFLFSCGSSGETVSENGAVDTTLAMSLDTNNSENFIASFCEQRRLIHHEDEEYRIKGEEAFVNGSFKLFNFTESTESYSWMYCVALNPASELHFGDIDISYFIEAEQLLLDNQLCFSIFAGNITPSYDFKMDGSADFLLTDNSGSYHTSIVENQTVVLYNGTNELIVTPICANSSYDASDPEEFIGVIETFEFYEPKNQPVKIKLHHHRREFPTITNHLHEVAFTLTWQWSPEPTDVWGAPEWVTGLISEYSYAQELFSFFEEKQTSLHEDKENKQPEKFTIQENCANGGPNYFQLTLVQNSTADYYIISDNEDDVGTYVVMDIEQPDSLNYIFYTARIEKFEANTTGYSEIATELSVIYITVEKDSINGDIEWHHFTNDEEQWYPYTRHPEQYTFVPCTY